MGAGAGTTLGSLVPGETILFSHLLDENGLILVGHSNGAVPTTAGIYAPGAVVVRTDNKKLYQNTGTTASPSFNAVGDIAAGEITLADGALLVGGADGVAHAQTPSGDVTITNGGVTAIGAKKVLEGMIALANHKVLIGDAGGAAAAMAVTGDVTISDAGVTAIGAGKVTSPMLAAGAGVAALLTAGLGGSHASPNTEAATTTVVAADGAKDRAAIVVVVIDETYADNGGTQSTLKVGEDDTVEKAFAAATIANKTVGTVLVAAFTNLATKKIITTTTAKIGAGTGAASVTVIAIPTT